MPPIVLKIVGSAGLHDHVMVRTTARFSFVHSTDRMLLETANHTYGAMSPLSPVNQDTWVAGPRL